MATKPILASTYKLGIHILHPEEIEKADEMFANPDVSDYWRYVTIPFTLEDLGKKDQWAVFFDKAQQKKIVPIVRLTTRFQDNAWSIPTKKNIVEQIDFLNQFSWPTKRKHIIVYNEVNHAKEWGNTINPAEYANVLQFASDWAHTSDPDFFILPAGLDLAASQSHDTVDAFWFLEQMTLQIPDIFNSIDGWNSHSYPNPGFTSSPYLKTRNSLRGFEYELTYLTQKGKEKIPVYITETGWNASRFSVQTMVQYYQYAIDNIWSHPQVVTATPFLLQGAPGPYAGFSFYDEHGNPTNQLLALQQILKLQL